MKHQVIRERAGDRTLWEVTDLSGRVVSASPRALRAALALADHLDADALHENDLDRNE